VGLVVKDGVRHVGPPAPSDPRDEVSGVHGTAGPGRA
jgi:hypothetical protein